MMFVAKNHQGNGTSGGVNGSNLRSFQNFASFCGCLLGLNLVHLGMNELATKKDLANTKSVIIKWMFIFSVGQLAAMIAIAKLFFHS
jgi:hypothetical protein